MPGTFDDSRNKERKDRGVPELNPLLNTLFCESRSGGQKIANRKAGRVQGVDLREGDEGSTGSSPGSNHTCSPWRRLLLQAPLPWFPSASLHCQQALRQLRQVRRFEEDMAAASRRHQIRSCPLACWRVAVWQQLPHSSGHIPVEKQSEPQGRVREQRDLAKERATRKWSLHWSQLEKSDQTKQWFTVLSGDEPKLATTLVGADVETGGKLWNHLNFHKLYDRNFDINSVMIYPHVQWMREAELKHGRIAMLAIVGVVVQAQSSFGHVPNQPAWTKVVAECFESPHTTFGMLQILIILGFIEGESNANMSWAGRLDHEPGDLGFDPLKLSKNEGLDMEKAQL